MSKKTEIYKRILSRHYWHISCGIKEKGKRGREYKCQKNMKRANPTNVPCVEPNLIHNNSSSST